MKIQKLAIAMSAVSVIFISGCDSTSVTKTLSDMGLPVPNQTEETSTGAKILAGVSGCAVGGAVGYFGAEYVGKKLQEEGYDYTSDELKQATVLVAGLGCVVGGKAALVIIENMDKEAKRAQEEAWMLAQQQSQTQATRTPQIWESEGYKGEVEIVEPIRTAEGRDCATRRNFIKTPDGTAEQYIPVCKNNNGFYEEVPV